MSETVSTLELISLADAALARDGAIETTISAIAQYSEAFGAWYNSNRGNLEACDGTSPERAQYEELDRKHRDVLQLSKVLIASTQIDLRKLKVKGKGILAYLDTLPERVSIRGSRKG